MSANELIPCLDNLPLLLFRLEIALEMGTCFGCCQVSSFNQRLVPNILQWQHVLTEMVAFYVVVSERVLRWSGSDYSNADDDIP